MADHPHACGDKVFALILRVSIIGSSPRVWGQEMLNFFILLIAGIIPTRVGTSDFEIIENRYGGDHPHACGDKHGI